MNEQLVSVNANNAATQWSWLFVHVRSRSFTWILYNTRCNTIADNPCVNNPSKTLHLTYCLCAKLRSRRQTLCH